MGQRAGKNTRQGEECHRFGEQVEQRHAGSLSEAVDAETL
jgi:hypothetical protein